MDYERLVDLVRLDGDRLVSASRGRLAEPIPTCPGWSMRDLVSHVAQVYEHKIACTELGHAPDPWPPVWPTDRDPIDWLADAHGRLLGMFREHEATDPSATWWPEDQTVGFWARRMAHETAIHRVDAELAAGDVTPVDPELALDGIDEVLTIMLAGDWSEEPVDERTPQRAAVVADGRRWTVTIDRETVAVTEDDNEVDAMVEGEPSAVVRWLWGRADDEAVMRSGAEPTVRLLRARLARATQ